MPTDVPGHVWKAEPNPNHASCEADWQWRLWAVDDADIKIKLIEDGRRAWNAYHGARERVTELEAENARLKQVNNPSELVKEMAKSIVDHLDRMEPDSTRREEVVANIIHNQLMAIVNTWTPEATK